MILGTGSLTGSLNAGAASSSSQKPSDSVKDGEVPKPLLAVYNELQKKLDEQQRIISQFQNGAIETAVEVDGKIHQVHCDMLLKFMKVLG